MGLIKVDKNFFEGLEKLKVNSLNIESDLYILNKKYLYKQFIDDDLDYLKEKEAKIDYLVQNKIVGTTNVFAKVNNENKFIGYVMDYIEDAIELKDILKYDLSQEDILTMMLEMSSTLERIHNNNIIYGDISESNIIVDKELKPYFVDMDGAIVNGIGQSNIPKLLFNNKFIEDFTPSKKLDIHLLNMLFLNSLTSNKISTMEKQEFIKEVNDLPISNELKKYFSNMVNGLQSEYATNYIDIELQNKYTK